MAAERSRKKQRLEAVATSGGGGWNDSGNGGGYRSWEDMSPEVLGLIFGRLPADVVLRSVPFVCRSWRAAASGPYFWADIDIQKWCRRVNRTDLIDAAVRRLVRRSAGSLRRLSAYRIGNSSFLYTAQCVKCLTVLQIPMSEVIDDTVEKYAQSLSTLTVLDISYCLKITVRGIETLGKHCKSLVHLRRNMPPPDLDLSLQGAVPLSKDSEGEALAVANTMPGLRHLELCYGCFTDVGLDAIVTQCGYLDVLDVRGCLSVKMERDLGDRCWVIKDFRSPWYDEYEDFLG